MRFCDWVIVSDEIVRVKYNKKTHGVHEFLEFEGFTIFEGEIGYSPEVFDEFFHLARADIVRISCRLVNLNYWEFREDIVVFSASFGRKVYE